jgi:hypothetical protein
MSMTDRFSLAVAGLVLQRRRRRPGELTSVNPQLSIAPDVFAVGQASEAFLCVTNGSAGITGTLRPGDKFIATFGSASGSIDSYESTAYVNSAILKPSDFSVRQGTSSKQLLIYYVGATKSFVPGDTVCVKLAVAAPAAVGSARSAEGSHRDVGGYLRVHRIHCRLYWPAWPLGPTG